MEHDRYSDAYIRGILTSHKTIAMVGASANKVRPSYFAMRYLMEKGFRVIPVNPGHAGKTLLGETIYAGLKEIPDPVDIVDIFRNSDAALAITKDAIEIGAKVVWMQLTVRNDEAARLAEDAGLQVVMNRCPKIEYGRLSGEIGWSGVDTGTISSKSPKLAAEGYQHRVLGDGSKRAKITRGLEMSDDKIAGFDTLAIHAGAEPDPATGARATPIYQTTSFVFDDADHAASLFNLETFGNIYTRITNPTQAVLESRIAALEGGTAALAVASGHAAQYIVFHTLLEPGDEFIAARQLYGGSINQFGQSFKKSGWHVRWADGTDPASIKAEVTDKTKAIFIESVANPGGIITDMEAISAVAKEAGVPLIVDSTLATPYLCKPIEHGADIIIHSLTKFLGGHGNSIGGAIVDCGTFDWLGSGRYPTMSEPNESYHGIRFAETFGNFGFAIACRALGLRDIGAAIAPLNAFLVITGIETLGLRMQRHSDNALAVATYLEGHDKVTWVQYAGLPSSEYHGLAQKYCPNGAGAVFTFGVKGGYDAGVNLVGHLDLFSHLANIGDTRSLVIHPASTTHRQLNDEQRAAAGDEVVRLSVGLEDAHDIVADLEQALAKI